MLWDKAAYVGIIFAIIHRILHPRVKDWLRDPITRRLGQQSIQLNKPNRPDGLTSWPVDSRSKPMNRSLMETQGTRKIDEQTKPIADWGGE